MNKHTANRNSLPYLSPVATGLCGLLLTAAASSAAVIADLRGNYDASTRTNGVAANIADTQGSGRWTFDARNTATVGATRTQLFYSTTANGVRTANAYVLPAGTLSLPAISNSLLITGPLETAPAANQLALHPGQQGSTLPFLGIRWTPGADEYGAATITGSLQDIGSNADGVTLLILNQSGTQLYNGASTGTIGSLASFNFAVTLASGSYLDFIIGNNGTFDGDHSVLSISIDGVPEPSAPLLSAAAFAIMALRRRR
jgi:hypothetical protein